jgi:uncharacterized membrane protein
MSDHTEDVAPDSAGGADGAVSAEGAGNIDLVGADRLIYFSDAVVAIAITLLALGLPGVKVGSDSVVLHSLGSNHVAYLPFLISFVVIAGYWRGHHRLFQYVTRIDSRLITINMIWLLMIICTPYVTRVLSGGSQFSAVRFSLYAVIQVITIVTFVVMRRHVRDRGLLRASASRIAAPVDDLSFLAVAAAFAISIPIAFATKSQWTYLVWVAAGFAARAARRLRDPLRQAG